MESQICNRFAWVAKNGRISYLPLILGNSSMPHTYHYLLIGYVDEHQLLVLGSAEFCILLSCTLLNPVLYFTGDT